MVWFDYLGSVTYKHAHIHIFRGFHLYTGLPTKDEISETIVRHLLSKDSLSTKTGIFMSLGI